MMHVLGQISGSRVTAPGSAAMNYDVETSYSNGKHWTFWNEYGSLDKARYAVAMLKRSSPENFTARIIKKEVLE